MNPSRTDETIAIDCDLGYVYAWSDRTGPVLNGADDIGAFVRFIADRDWSGPLTILFEIASAVGHGQVESRGAAYLMTKWAIFNAMQAARLDTWLTVTSRFHRMLVAPSAKWTKGYDVKTRHIIAACSAPNKDQRECQAMLWFHRKDPTAWVSLPDYERSLTAIARKAAPCSASPSPTATPTAPASSSTRQRPRRTG